MDEKRWKKSELGTRSSSFDGQSHVSSLNLQRQHSMLSDIQRDNHVNANDKEKDFQILYIPPKAPVQAVVSRLTFLGSLFSAVSPKSSFSADTLKSPRGKGRSLCEPDGDKQKQISSVLTMGFDFSQVTMSFMLLSCTSSWCLFKRVGRSVKTLLMFERTWRHMQSDCGRHQSWKRSSLWGVCPTAWLLRSLSM